jgi:hypothetical protein
MTFDVLSALEAWHKKAGDGERYMNLEACDGVWLASLRQASYEPDKPATECIATGRGFSPAVAIEAALAEAKVQELCE